MSKSQILVVDDERIVATCIQNELEGFGYQVSGIASSAKDAIEKADQFHPDLVLMDIHLKGDRDGIDAAREIHAHYGTPIVYLSAFADAESVARAADTGAFGYLLKPYEGQELKTTIEMALAMHRAEQRLAETERWLAATLEGVDDAIITADADCRIHFMNHAACNLTGWDKDEAAGKSLSDVCHLARPHGQFILEDVASQDPCDWCDVAIAKGTDLIDRSGQRTPVEGRIAPIFDPHGEYLGTALTVRSIAPRLELERTQREGEENVRQSQKLEAVRRLAGGMAHHLNNLVTVILGNTSLAMTQSAVESEGAEALTRVEAASHRAADMIRRLLRFSGEGHGRFQQVDLNTLLSTFLVESKQLFDPSLRVTCKPTMGLWPVSVDEVQVGQALVNLCLGIQDSLLDGGRIVLDCENLALKADDSAEPQRIGEGNFVRARIGMTGRGLTQEVYERLAAQLTRGGSSRHDAGIGLEFVTEVMEQHHGWVECSHSVEAGIQFDLYFPSSGQIPAMESTTALPPRSRGLKPTVLLAESDAMVRALGQQILERQGYQVLSTDDGIQAVELFRKSPVQVDLAIIDLNLPRITGDAILERLVDLDPNIEIFFSSGYFSEDHYESGGHVLGVIRKPYSRHELVSLVQRALARHSACALAHGRISKISLPDGAEHPETACGTISTCDGREVHFHANSLVDLALHRLELGSEVRFEEEMTEHGPQAKCVRPLVKNGHFCE
ncbi:response regulator [Schlesneria paludicola]|uniref:response regulator n=1 Tax=Schlesneria paludicola TaxID=360056 RepID=UPI00029B3F85|nr:response regulator [Schlesneria paludicola]